MARGVHPVIPKIDVTPGANQVDFTDLDLSAHISPDTVGVMLHVTLSSFSNITCWFRKNGSTDPVPTTAVLDDFCTHVEYVGVDSNGVLESYISNVSNVSVYLIGYFESDSAYFPTNSIYEQTSTPSGNSQWVNRDVSSIVQGGDTAIAALGVYSLELTNDEFGVRPIGNTQGNEIRERIDQMCGWVVKLDNNNQFQWYHTNSVGAGQRSLVIRGYLKNGSGTFNTDYIELDRTGWTANAWNEAPALLGRQAYRALLSRTNSSGPEGASGVSNFVDTPFVGRAGGDRCGQLGSMLGPDGRYQCFLPSNGETRFFVVGDIYSASDSDNPSALLMGL